MQPDPFAHLFDDPEAAPEIEPDWCDLCERPEDECGCDSDEYFGEWEE